MQNHPSEHARSGGDHNGNQPLAREPRKLDDFQSHQTPSCKTERSGAELHQRVTGEKQNAALLQFPITVAEWDRNSREVVRVELGHYQGHHTINVRSWYRDGAELKPTRSGINLSIKHLPDLASAFATALENAYAMGLLGDGGGGR